MWNQIKKNKFAYFCIAPFFIFYIIFDLGPIIFSFILSFCKWGLFGQRKFLGLANYYDLLSDSNFLASVVNTLCYWSFIVPIIVFVSLVIATLMNLKNTRMKSTFRFIYILPYITSPVLMAVLCRILFATEGGSLNVVLQSVLGIKSIPWLTSNSFSKLPVSFLSIWMTLGYFILIMLGGLQRIQPEIYEAAIIDGANQFQLFWKITFPLMKTIILFVLIICTINTLRIFAVPFILTEGGPQWSSAPLSMILYRNGFEYFRLGYASSVAVVMFLIIGTISFLQLKLFSLRRQ